MWVVRWRDLRRIGALFALVVVAWVLVPSTARPNPAGRYLVVNTLRRTVTLFDGQRPLLSYPVAIGKSETPTPLGEFRIIEKARWGGGFGTRWMRLSVPWGQYGLHGTNRPWSIGTRASHGCIRMNNKNVEILFEHVTVGMPILVTGAVPYARIRRTLTLRDMGEDVVEAQRMLRAVGSYGGSLGGMYDVTTEAAVKAFQAGEKLTPTGRLDGPTLKVLQQLQPPPPIEYGNGGPAVSRIQERLKALGDYPGVPDGIFGPATERAVKGFQTRSGLPATGIVDAKTRERLERAVPSPPMKPKGETTH